MLPDNTTSHNITSFEEEAAIVYYQDLPDYNIDVIKIQPSYLFNFARKALDEINSSKHHPPLERTLFSFNTLQFEHDIYGVLYSNITKLLNNYQITDDILSAPEVRAIKRYFHDFCQWSDIDQDSDTGKFLKIITNLPEAKPFADKKDSGSEIKSISWKDKDLQGILWQWHPQKQYCTNQSHRQ